MDALLILTALLLLAVLAPRYGADSTRAGGWDDARVWDDRSLHPTRRRSPARGGSAHWPRGRRGAHRPA